MTKVRIYVVNLILMGIIACGYAACTNNDKKSSSNAPNSSESAQSVSRPNQEAAHSVSDQRIACDKQANSLSIALAANLKAVGAPDDVIEDANKSIRQSCSSMLLLDMEIPRVSSMLLLASAALYYPNAIIQTALGMGQDGTSTVAEMVNVLRLNFELADTVTAPMIIKIGQIPGLLMSIATLPFVEVNNILRQTQSVLPPQTDNQSISQRVSETSQSTVAEIVSILKGFAAVGSTDASSAVAPLPTATPNAGSEQEYFAPVFVAMGGFNSCGNDAISAGFSPYSTPLARKVDALIADSVAEMSRRYAEFRSYAGEEIRWVYSCLDNKGDIFFASSNDHKIYGVPMAERGAVWNAIDRESDGRKRPVYIVGHSMGGWLAMRAILEIVAEVTVNGLVTIDPISPPNCNPATYVRLLSSLNPDDLTGCRQAPSDFSENDLSAIKRRLKPGGWKHFYQTNFLPLHSGPFSGNFLPDLSLDLSSLLDALFGSVRNVVNAHSQIYNCNSIWLSVQAMINRDLP